MAGMVGIKTIDADQASLKDLVPGLPLPSVAYCATLMGRSRTLKGSGCQIILGMACVLLRKPYNEALFSRLGPNLANGPLLTSTLFWETSCANLEPSPLACSSLRKPL